MPGVGFTERRMRSASASISMPTGIDGMDYPAGQSIHQLAIPLPTGWLTALTRLLP